MGYVMINMTFHMNHSWKPYKSTSEITNLRTLREKRCLSNSRVLQQSRNSFPMLNAATLWSNHVRKWRNYPVAKNIFDPWTHEIAAASMSPDSGRFRGEIERRTRRGARRGEGKFTLAATLRECTPGRSRAAAATDPPTPTGDEKGRENERTGESCGASRLSW